MLTATRICQGAVTLSFHDVILFAVALSKGAGPVLAVVLYVVAVASGAYIIHAGSKLTSERDDYAHRP